MNGAQYLKDKLPALMINLLGMLALALFLMANGNGRLFYSFLLSGSWSWFYVCCLSTIHGKNI